MTHKRLVLVRTTGGAYADLVEQCTKSVWVDGTDYTHVPAAETIVNSYVSAGWSVVAEWDTWEELYDSLCSGYIVAKVP